VLRAILLAAGATALRKTYYKLKAGTEGTFGHKAPLSGRTGRYTQTYKVSKTL
jgi:hypothetical protein